MNITLIAIGSTIGAILILMLTLHIIRRFAAPFRIRIYLKSGQTVKFSVEDFNSTATRLSWTHADAVPEIMTIPHFEEIAVITAVDRRKHF